MEAWERIVCGIFKVKGLEYVPKDRLAKALATLNVDYEQLYLELFEVCPKHKRFDKWSPEAKEQTMLKIRELRYEQTHNNKPSAIKRGWRAGQKAVQDVRCLFGKVFGYLYNATKGRSGCSTETQP